MTFFEKGRRYAWFWDKKKWIGEFVEMLNPMTAVFEVDKNYIGGESYERIIMPINLTLIRKLNDIL